MNKTKAVAVSGPEAEIEKVRAKVERAFEALEMIKRVLERLDGSLNFTGSERHKQAVRLLNLIVNMGEWPTPAKVKEVWALARAGEECLKRIKEPWVRKLSPIQLRLHAITIVKAAWAPDLRVRRKPLAKTLSTEGGQE
ncbi:MAG: hypothetical protein Q7R93_02085 [bacterium]|nr:hypothetical protein [bacterium]